MSQDKNREELVSIIEKTKSPIYGFSSSENIADAILSAGYHTGKVIEGEEAEKFLKDAGYIKKDRMGIDEEKLLELAWGFLNTIIITHTNQPNQPKQVIFKEDIPKFAQAIISNKERIITFNQ